MKLKKIASLALAGVMAVGMLAGCATTKPETKPVDPDQPATGVSTSVGALMKNVPEFVTFADSSKLNGALDYTMEWAGAQFVLNKYVYQEDLTPVHDFDNALKAKLDVEDVDTVGMTEIGKITNDTNGEAAIAYELYAVSGTKGENAVKQMVADKLATFVKDYKKYDLHGDNWDYAYTVSVSIDSKTVNSVGVGGVHGGIHGNGGVAILPGMGVVGGSVNGGIHGGSTSAADPTVTFVAVQVVRSAVRQ